METCVGYLRVSGQLEMDSFPRQRATIQKYADQNGIQIVEWFSDERVTGTVELEKRPGLAACLARVTDNGVHLVLVEIADRLARDSVIAELIIREFQKAKCRVISASGGVDLTAGDNSNPTAKLVRQILAAIAEFDRCIIISKLNAGRARKRALGERAEGPEAFGKKSGELETLDKIICAKKGGLRPDAIAKMLNDRGIPTRYGKRWHSGTVSKILARQTVTT